MPAVISLGPLTNPLILSSHLETSASQLDGVPIELEDAVRHNVAKVLQAAGILLHLPQDIIAQAIILLFRYLSGPDGGSLLEYDAKDIAAAALYLAAKPSGHSITPRQVLTTFAYLSSVAPSHLHSTTPTDALHGTQWSLSEGDLEAARLRLYAIEAHILHTLGFQTHVALPYPLCVNYLQTLDVFASPAGSALAKRTVAHLNTALLSPQMLYLTHQPNALATAAIYLAAREVDVNLPECEWWEVFDVDREELGFLVVALQSTVSFAIEQAQLWEGKQIPLTVAGLRAAIEHYQMEIARES